MRAGKTPGFLSRTGFRTSVVDSEGPLIHFPLKNANGFAKNGPEVRRYSALSVDREALSGSTRMFLVSRVELNLRRMRLKPLAERRSVSYGQACSR
jgi:hypothetical protein